MAPPGSEATVRGFSAVPVLLVDEAARVSEELYLAIRPMLGSERGIAVADEHALRKAGVLLLELGAGRGGVGTDPGAGDGVHALSAQFLERERATMGERWFRQE